MRNQFEYNKCNKGDLLYLTTQNKSDNEFCKFEKGQKLLTKVVYFSDYLITLIDRKGERHTFLSEWFKETKDEFHGEPTLFNPGIVVKFTRVDSTELPLGIKIRKYFNILFKNNKKWT
jgi:hypothetical protein